MSVTVDCQCGQQFTSSDGNAGRAFLCTNCGASLKFPGRAVSKDFGALHTSGAGRDRQRVRRASESSQAEARFSNPFSTGQTIFIGVVVVAFIALVIVVRSLRNPGDEQVQQPDVATRRQQSVQNDEWQAEQARVEQAVNEGLRLQEDESFRAFEAALSEAMHEEERRRSLTPTNTLTFTESTVNGVRWTQYTTPGGEVSLITPSPLNAMADVSRYQPGAQGFEVQLPFNHCRLVIEALDPALANSGREEQYRAILHDLRQRGVSVFEFTSVDEQLALKGRSSGESQILAEAMGLANEQLQQQGRDFGTLPAPTMEINTNHYSLVVGQQVFHLEFEENRGGSLEEVRHLLSSVRFAVRPDEFRSAIFSDGAQSILTWRPYTIPGEVVTFFVPGSPAEIVEITDPPGFRSGSVAYIGESEQFKYKLVIEPLDPGLLNVSEETLFDALRDDIFSRGASGCREVMVDGRRALEGLLGDFDNCTARDWLVPVDGYVYGFQLAFDAPEFQSQAECFQRLIRLNRPSEEVEQ